MKTVIQLHKGDDVIHTIIVDKPCNLMEEGMKLMSKLNATGFTLLVVEESDLAV